MAYKTIVYVIQSYEDNEVKGVFSTMELAQSWMKENRADREEDCQISVHDIQYKYGADTEINL